MVVGENTVPITGEPSGGLWGYVWGTGTGAKNGSSSTGAVGIPAEYFGGVESVQIQAVRTELVVVVALVFALLLS